eukprot:TRINITY_DN11445_c0_g1_i1.p1 TRINITY_DN11445_c0_g1~~TRINITY_DN11445_c0_g1_i1.p1  ORF type:complete len:673 (-),score=84.09 TRINITY_DN11445_c0_g1_i1:122-2140(-)
MRAVLILLFCLCYIHAYTFPVGIYVVNCEGPSVQSDWQNRDILRLWIENTEAYGEYLAADSKIDRVFDIRYSEINHTITFIRDSAVARLFYSATIVDGVMVGRFAIMPRGSSRPSSSLYINHITAWNADVFDQTSSRSFDVRLANSTSVLSARIRLDIDQSGHYLGIMKQYYAANTSYGGEELEFDLVVHKFTRTSAVFTLTQLMGNSSVVVWTQQCELEFGLAPRVHEIAGICIRRYALSRDHSSNTDKGSSFDSAVDGGNGESVYKVTGARVAVLNPGLFPYSADSLARYQAQTRRQIAHLTMSGAPQPLHVSVRSAVVSVSGSSLGSHRDDDPSEWPQRYELQEMWFEYTLPDPYLPGATVQRAVHGYLARPKDVQDGELLDAVLCLNGHRGSAWQMMFTPNDTIYWYGDAVARRPNKVVLAIDVGHRPYSVLYGSYSDDPEHGNGPHPSVLCNGFNTSDWEEDGERLWDAIRSLSYLLSQPNINTAHVAVTGLSMGGEITTLLGAMDTRVTLVSPAGYSPDVDVVYHHGNHPCWQWTNANIREYLDAETLHALIAPRPLLIHTGKADQTYSSLPTSFASDKQLARRTRVLYEGVNRGAFFLHYLHYDVHRWHDGDVGAEELFVRVPVKVGPVSGSGWEQQEWQSDAETMVVDGREWTLFRWWAELWNL